MLTQDNGQVFVRACAAAGTVFVTAAFLAGVDYAFFASAFANRQRFFVAATIAALPAALSLRFGLGASGVAGTGGSDWP